jgi:hypothetical protein
VTQTSDVDIEEAKRLSAINGKNDIARRFISRLPGGRIPEIFDDKKTSHPKDDDRASTIGPEHSNR